jgi:cbb3-type cytochrome oxidase cytochrome c subunit
MKKVVLVLVLLLAIAQVFRIDKTNPPADMAQDFLVLTKASPEMSDRIKNACYDCHSHHSVYPWYTNISPISFLIKSHMKNGRKKLNFSTWSAYDAEKAAHKLEECAEEVGEKHMPLKSYTWLHPKAKLTDKQRDELIAWFNALAIANKGQ